MDFLKTIIKISGNEYASIAEDGIAAGDIAGFIDTGAYSLNALLSGSIYGGMPSNKITALAGEPSTGKTFIAIGTIKAFLDANPEARVACFFTESDVSKKILEDRGVDTSRVGIFPVDTVESFRTQLMRTLVAYQEIKEKERPPFLCVLDSLGMLSTIKEMTDIESGSEKKDMTRAALAKGAFRALTLKLGQVRVPLLITNHIYDVVGSYIPMKKMGGGSGPVYSASQIVFLTKKRAKEGNKTDGDHIGSIITCILDKSRFTIERKKVEILLRFDTGLSRYYGLLDLAERFGIVEKKNSATDARKKVWAFPNGTEAPSEKEIYDHPKTYFTKDVLDLIDLKCQDEFLYGKSNLTNIELSDETIEEVATKSDNKKSKK